jgi:hypothetical protein
MLELYSDLLADVRYDNRYHSIRGLVQPDEPTVVEIARVLVQAPDFISAAQDFVDSFTTYQREIGDYWATPGETLARAEGDDGLAYGDCDDKAILLCSILRNYIPPDKVFCAFGMWKGEGHMWVVAEGEGEEDRIVEATASSDKSIKDNYNLMAIFNDRYAFATDEAIRHFALRKVAAEREAELCLIAGKPAC